MQNEHLIPARIFCLHHELEVAFINTIGDYGLVHLTRIEDEDYIEDTELEKLERIARLHRELQVNAEGIDVINHMLDTMHRMQSEINNLKNRLAFYEGPGTG